MSWFMLFSTLRRGVAAAVPFFHGGTFKENAVQYVVAFEKITSITT